MNFSLINGCGTCEKNNHSRSFFWSGTCEFTNLQKKNQVIKNVILQSIGIIVIEIRETKAVILYSSGQSLIPLEYLQVYCFSTFHYCDPYWL